MKTSLSVGREAATTSFNWLGGAGLWAARTLIGESAGKAQQNHLRQYVGRLVLVGGLPEEASSAQMNRAMLQSASFMDERKLLRPHRTIGIRPMVPASVTDEPTHLVRTANVLGDTIIDNFGLLPIVDPDPILCDAQRSGSGSEAAYKALDGALNRLEKQTGLSEHPTLLGFVIVTDSRYAARALRRHTHQSFSYEDLSRGGAVELQSVGTQPTDNIWVGYHL